MGKAMYYISLGRGLGKVTGLQITDCGVGEDVGLQFSGTSQLSNDLALLNMGKAISPCRTMGCRTIGLPKYDHL